MKKNTILIAIIMLLCNSLFATTYTFTGIGNWSDVARWSPILPTIIAENDSILINGKCTITSGQFIQYGSDTAISSLIYFQFIVNDTLINYGDISLSGLFESKNSLYNFGNISTFPSITSGVNVEGYIYNSGTIACSGSYFINTGLLDNYNNIWADEYLINNSTINSYGGFFGSGPMGGFANNGIINGEANFMKLANSNTSILSPGYGFGDTDTMEISSQFHSSGIINFDINSTDDKDLIILNNSYWNTFDDSLGDIVVNINPGFTPSVLDTFILFQGINSTFNAPFNNLQLAKIKTNLPTPPSGLIWIVKQEPSRIYITLDFALPEPVTFFKFYANKQNNKSVLHYKLLENDDNLDHFVVERAGKDFNFVSIGQFKYDENNLEYTFIDANPLEGENLYHIIAFNKDGKVNQPFVTNTHQLFFYETKGVVLNTIVENELLISLEKSTELKIINQNGGIVFKQTFEKGHSKISLSHLSKGIYFVQTNNATNKILKL